MKTSTTYADIALVWVDVAVTHFTVRTRRDVLGIGLGVVVRVFNLAIIEVVEFGCTLRICLDIARASFVIGDMQIDPFIVFIVLETSCRTNLVMSMLAVAVVMPWQQFATLTAPWRTCSFGI